MRFPLHSARFSSRSSGRRPVRLAVVACLSLAGAAICAGTTAAAARRTIIRRCMGNSLRARKGGRRIGLHLLLSLQFLADRSMAPLCTARVSRPVGSDQATTGAPGNHLSSSEVGYAFAVPPRCLDRFGKV